MMKMATSQVETVSPSTLICGQKDRNRQENCRDNNVRGTETVLENNLKVLVRDHLSNSPKSADSGTNSKNQAKDGDNKNDSGRIEDSDSRSKDRVLDRRPGKSGETNKQNQDSRNRDSKNLNGESNSNKSSNPENPNQNTSNPSEEETRSRNEKCPASSLVQMWEARLQQPIANPNQNSNNRTNAAPSVSETLSLDSSNAGISTFEEKDDNNNSNNDTENQINNGDETDWDSQSDMNSVSDTTEKERVNSVSGSADEERVRIFDIIRKLSSDPDQANSSTGSVSEQAVVQSTTRIRGRQAFADLLLQMERSRQKELLSISERHVVSKFTHRGRLQSMLKIRCMQRCIAIQGRNRPKSAASESSRNGLIHPREKPKTVLENGGDGRKETTNAKNLEDSRMSRNNDNSAKNRETECLVAQETKGGSLLPPQGTIVKTAEEIVTGKMQKASKTEIDEKNSPRIFSEKANSRKIAEKSNSDSTEDGKRAALGQHRERVVLQENGEKAVSREIDENLFLRKNLEKCGLLEAAGKTVGRENVEKAVLKDVEKNNRSEAREEKIFRENANKVDSGSATEKIVLKQTGEKAVVKENSRRETEERTVSKKITETSDFRQTTEKSIGRETAEKPTSREATEKGKSIGETTKKNESCQIAEKMNIRKATDKTNSRETAEKTNLRDPAEKSNFRDAAEKTVALETPDKAASKTNSRGTTEKTNLGETAEKTNFRNAAGKETAREIPEKAITRETREKSNSREIAKEIAKKKGETQNAEKTKFDGNSRRSLNETQKSHTETDPYKDSSEKETSKIEKRIANETAGTDELGKKEKDRKEIAETSTSRNSLEKSKIQERLEANGRLEESTTRFDSDRDRFLEGEETDLLKGWEGNEEEELEDYSDDPSYCAEDSYDWFSDISRPKSYWEDLRKQWYLEVLNTDSGKHDIRQLLQRQSVSNFLSSDLKEKIDRLMISRTQGRENTDKKQEEEEGGDEQWEAIETDQERDCEIAREATNANAEFQEASSDRLSQSSSSLMCGMSPMRSWSYHDQEVADDRDQDASMFPAAQSAHSAFPANHTAPVSMEMQLICDLRSQMEQLQREVSELKNSMKSCITQLNMQKSLGHDTQSGGGPKSMSERKCCVCNETPVDSLLYRCGHMCTCLKCANELQWSSGKCPKCLAPIVDVVRVFL